MTDLPSVPIQHEVSRAAVRWVESRLPGTWVVHKPSEGDDYGIDLRIEIATNRTITGRQLVVQVKGTSLSDEMSRARIKLATVAYLRKLSDPAVVLRVCPSESRIRIVPLEDPRFDSDNLVHVPFYDSDEINESDLTLILDRIACRHEIEKGNEKLIIGLDTDIQVRRMALHYGGRLDSILSFQIHSDSSWQQYSCVLNSASQLATLRSCAPPFKQMEIPFSATFGEVVTAYVSFLFLTEMPRTASRKLLQSAELLDEVGVNESTLLECAIGYLTSEQISSLLSTAIRSRVSWVAKWIDLLLRCSVRLQLSVNDVNLAFDRQKQKKDFSMLAVYRANALLMTGNIDATSDAILMALDTPRAQREKHFYFELSDVCARIGDYDTCIELLRDGWERYERPHFFGLELAKYLLMQHRWDDAKAILAATPEPMTDPENSLYRICHWLIVNALVVTSPLLANMPLSYAWQTVIRAFHPQPTATEFAEAAIALECLPDENMRSAVLFYGAILFGGDPVRIMLEHPKLTLLSNCTKGQLDALAVTLDAMRGGRVPFSIDIDLDNNKKRVADPDI